MGKLREIVNMKNMQFIVGLKLNKKMYRFPLQGVPHKVIHYICQKIEPLFQISIVRMETTYNKDKPQKIIW